MHCLLYLLTYERRPKIYKMRNFAVIRGRSRSLEMVRNYVPFPKYSESKIAYFIYSTCIWRPVGGDPIGI